MQRCYRCSGQYNRPGYRYCAVCQDFINAAVQGAVFTPPYMVFNNTGNMVQPSPFDYFPAHLALKLKNLLLMGITTYFLIAGEFRRI